MHWWQQPKKESRLICPLHSPLSPSASWMMAKEPLAKSILSFLSLSTFFPFPFYLSFSLYNLFLSLFKCSQNVSILACFSCERQLHPLFFSSLCCLSKSRSISLSMFLFHFHPCFVLSSNLSLMLMVETIFDWGQKERKDGEREIDREREREIHL